MIYVFKRNHTKFCILRLFCKDQNWIIRGFIFQSNLANVTDGVRLFLKCPHFWRTEPACEGQKLYKDTDCGNTFKRQSEFMPGRILANIMNLEIFFSLTSSHNRRRLRESLVGITVFSSPRLMKCSTYCRIIVSQNMLEVVTCLSQCDINNVS